MKDYISNDIDLDYIGASDAKSFIRSDLYDLLLNLIQEDLGRIEGYISKYDNKWDRAEGTSVDKLKEAKKLILERLEKVRELDKSISCIK